MIRKGVGITLLLAILSSLTTAGLNSADSIYFDSNYGPLDGKALVFQWDSRKDTDKLNFHFKPSHLENETGKSFKTNFSLNIKRSSDFAEYSIVDISGNNRNKRSIYDLKPTRIEIPVYGQETREDIINNACIDLDGDGTAYDDYYNDYKGVSKKYIVADWAYCFSEEKKIGEVGRLLSPKTKISTVWQLKADGKTVEKTLSNDNTGDGKSSSFAYNGREVAIIEYSNLMTTGQSYYEPTNEYVLHNDRIKNRSGFSGEGWKIIDKGEYQRYNNWMRSSQPISLLESWGSCDETTFGNDVCSGNQLDKAEVEETANEYTIDASKSYTESPLELSNPSTNLEGTGFENGILKYEMDGKVAYPSFTGYILSGSDKEAFLEVSKNAGNPKIVNSTDNHYITELGSGEVSMSVKNIGKYTGSFTARVKSCGESFSSNSISRDLVLEPKEETSTDFKVSYSKNTDLAQVESTCTLALKEDTTGVEKTTTVKVIGQEAQDCTPSNRRAESINGKPTVVECKENGQQFQVLDSCEEGEHIGRSVNGSLVCVSERSLVDKECMKSINYGLGRKDYQDPVCVLKEQITSLTSQATALAILGLAAVSAIASITLLIAFSSLKWMLNLRK